MATQKWNLLTAAIAASLSFSATASEQAQSNGFAEDSTASILLRNAYFDRDRKDHLKEHLKDQSRWGQAFIGVFESGFTQGTVGFGLDAIGLYSLRLDQGKSRDDGGISFFATRDNGKPLREIGKAGAAAKVRLSSTVLKYGDQMPELPVLSNDTTRLIPQTFTGTLLTSKEIEGLELNVGRFTAQSDNNKAARDSGHLKSIDVIGGSYEFNENLNAALYHSDIKDFARKNYASLAYTFPIAEARSLAFDFGIYRTKYSKNFEETEGGRNTIWSLSSKYTMDEHAFIVAYQKSSGGRPYEYDYGDGGNTIWLANSFLSDYNAKDERSWQASYELDFTKYGMPGLLWKTAYIHGSNIDMSFYGKEGRATEREIFNQVEYVVQDGAAKDLSLKLRNSILRTSKGYWNDMNEVRVIIEYPLNLL